MAGSLLGEHGPWAHAFLQLSGMGLVSPWHVSSVAVACELQLTSSGSVFVADGLSCSVACEIFPDQGLNLCIGGRVLIHCASREVPLGVF